LEIIHFAEGVEDLGVFFLTEESTEVSEEGGSVKRFFAEEDI
jgi:hypothetical protein